MKATCSWPVRFLLFLFLTSSVACAAGSSPARTLAGDRLAGNYFRAETALLSENCLTDIQTLELWKARRDEYRTQLFEMLGLSPLPGRTDLKPVVTGKLDHELFTVEKLHFQSMPGLYVTANLYAPKNLTQPAPAILYLCGHAMVVTNGVSYGNKTGYEHHGSWFARNGYVCLVIDTVQLGEIQGLHHGTYREGMWWWNSRGYTSAGVEAWNGIRALDYLQSRPEVDSSRLGVTGRSGGGAYSWWVAALDDRIKAACPVAGITDLENHVVDGAVEGHCDCMFMVNTYRWDFPMVAALVAPRPLLICNTDKDSIFPLDGVERLHTKVAKIYKLYGATNNLGLLIAEGPHKDTQDLQLPVFRWFNRHLKGEDPVIAVAATHLFTPAQLKVFETLPGDERTSKIQETFVPLPVVSQAPHTASDWVAQRDSWKAALREKVFRGWPQDLSPPSIVLRDSDEKTNARLDIYEFTSQHDVPLRLYARQIANQGKPTRVRLIVLDEKGWMAWLNDAARTFPAKFNDELDALGTEASPDTFHVGQHLPGEIEAYFAPRGIGPTAWGRSERNQTQTRRRFMLLGQTLDGMRVWDIRRAIQALRSIQELQNLPIVIEGQQQMAVNVLYASLFEPNVSGLSLRQLPASHRNGPDYLNVLRVLDIPQAVGMALERTPVILDQSDFEDWQYPVALKRNLKWAADFQIKQNRDKQASGK